jgi:hypothetical protein
MFKTGDLLRHCYLGSMLGEQAVFYRAWLRQPWMAHAPFHIAGVYLEYRLIKFVGSLRNSTLEDTVLCTFIDIAPRKSDVSRDMKSRHSLCTLGHPLANRPRSRRCDVWATFSQMQLVKTEFSRPKCEWGALCTHRASSPRSGPPW